MAGVRRITGTRKFTNHPETPTKDARWVNNEWGVPYRYNPDQHQRSSWCFESAADDRIQMLNWLLSKDLILGIQTLSQILRVLEICTIFSGQRVWSKLLPDNTENWIRHVKDFTSMPFHSWNHDLLCSTQTNWALAAFSHQWSSETDCARLQDVCFKIKSEEL